MLRLRPAAGPQTQRLPGAQGGTQGTSLWPGETCTSLCPTGHGARPAAATLDPRPPKCCWQPRPAAVLNPVSGCTCAASGTPAPPAAVRCLPCPQRFQFPKRDKGVPNSPGTAAAASRKGPGMVVLVRPQGEPPRMQHLHCCMVQVYSSSRGVDRNPQLFLMFLPASFKAGN